MNILFTCAGRRNYLINYFKTALKGEGKIFAADMQLSAPAMVDADVSIQVPSIYDEKYIDSLIDIIKSNRITAVISLNDLELPVLSLNRTMIENAGAKLLVSDEHVIDISFDKKKTADFIQLIDLKTPDTFISLKEVLEKIEKGELKFPLVVKPRWGSASIGIDFPQDMEELKLSYQLQKKRLKDTILSKASEKNRDEAILIQEKIPGKEFGLDILNDFNGNYVGTFVREKLSMRAGETDKAISVIDNRFEKLGKLIGENLKHIGNLDCDIFDFNGELYVLELNPRFGGGYPFSHEAGINTTAIYIEWLKGNNDISKYINYREKLMFSKCDRLIPINIE
jgi:carbamoyl-phosphate synthase large subunit